MLLRSSSTPIFSSCLPHAIVDHSSPEHFEMRHQWMPRSRSLSLITAASPKPNLKLKLKLSRALSASDLQHFSVPPARPGGGRVTVCLFGSMEEDGQVGFGLYSSTTPSFDEECEAGFLVGGGCCGGGGSGDVLQLCTGDSSRGNDRTEEYYRRMMEADPGNSLILGNYARFLKEVRGDFARAEEYCGRAILANPNDGNALSMYADLVWRSDKDAERAETYFNRAMKVAPDDCYVMASYARFLWDAEEDVDVEVAAVGYNYSHATLPSLPPPIAAAAS